MALHGCFPRFYLLLPVTLILTFCLPSFGQSEDATVSGTITDPTGAVVQNAQVKLTNVETGITLTTLSNNSGLYVFPDVQPGQYRMVAEKAGFRQIVLVDLTLNVQDVLSRNFKLEVGAVGESMTVSGAGENVNTVSAAVSTLITSEQLENMPLNGRSLQSLIMLTPGMTLAPPNGGAGSHDTSNPGQFSSNGQRAYSNYVMVDGVSANAGTDSAGSPSGFSGGQPALTALGTTQSLVSVDDLQEFRIQTSTYAPEFGRSPGAQIELLTRSGSNAYHGSLFEYLRNNIFDAPDWFAEALSQPSPELRQNDFGGTLGGPVRLPGFNGRNRTFFFFSYEGLRLRQPSFGLQEVPSLATRQTTVPSILPFLNAFPLPTGADVIDPITGGPSGLAEFAKGISNPSTIDTWSVKIDHHFNDRFTIFGRYSKSPSSSKLRNMADVTISDDGNQTATVGATMVLNPTVLNELRWNFSRSSVSVVNALDNFGGAIAPPDSLLFPSPFASAQDSQLFLIVQTNSASPSYFAGTSAAHLQRQLNVVDSFSVKKGAHALKFGVDYRRLFPVVGPSSYNQYFTFTPGNLFDPIDGLTSGIASSFFLFTQVSDLKPVFVNLSLYAQDTWHVTPQLTVTYGLRWEFNPVPRNSNGPDPAVLTGVSNPATFALAPPGTPLYPTQYNDFAPRVGFAYELGQQAGWETVLRGGVGVYYDTGSTEVTSAFMGYPLQSNTFLFDVPYPLTQAQLAPPPATLNGASFIGYDPDFNLPRTVQWNVALGQALGTAQTLTTSYVGSIGRRLLQLNAYFPPNGINGTVSIYRGTGTSDYNALQVQYQRRLSHGLQALGSYTWAHAIDDLSDDGEAIEESSRGNSNFDIRQNFAASLSYDIPTLSQSRAPRGLLGGWSLDTIIHGQSAAPVNIEVGNSYTPAGNFAIRPDVVPGVPFYLYGNQCPSLDLSIPEWAAHQSPRSDIAPNGKRPIYSGDTRSKPVAWVAVGPARFCRSTAV
jgi:hypothetical protein